MDVSGGSGACPELNKTERKKIIQIYVFMYRYGVTPKTSSKIAFLTAFHISKRLLWTVILLDFGPRYIRNLTSTERAAVNSIFYSF